MLSFDIFLSSSSFLFSLSINDSYYMVSLLITSELFHSGVLASIRSRFIPFSIPPSQCSRLKFWRLFSYAFFPFFQNSSFLFPISYFSKFILNFTFYIYLYIYYLSLLSGYIYISPSFLFLYIARHSDI